MSSLSPILLIALDKAQHEALDELAHGMGYSNAHLATGEMLEIIRELDSRTKPPEIMVIDIGARQDEAMPLLDEIAQHCEPSVLVFVIGEANDVQLYRTLKQRGVTEYFPKPVTASDISANLLQIKNQMRKDGHQGKVVACMSAASGDGSSTLAMNTAYGLAHFQNASAVLVDMDYQFGLIAKNLDLTAPFGTRELFENPDRGLDDLLVQKMLVKYTDNCDIIASPNELRLMPEIKPETIEELLQVLRGQYDFVVCEVPHIWTDWTAAVLKNADEIYLVAQLWLRSLTHTTRMLNAWRQAGINRDKIKLVINRSGAKFKEAISAEEFERICNQPIYAHLNNDIKAVVAAENQGKTILETASGSMLEQQFRQMIEHLASSGPSDSTDNGSNKKGIRQMFDKKPDKRVGA